MRKVPLKSRFGCLRCRERRKKCDEQKPSCGECCRLGTKCRWKTSDLSHSQLPARNDSLAWAVDTPSQTDTDFSRFSNSSHSSPDHTSREDGESFDQPDVLQASATSVVRDLGGKLVLQYLWEQGYSILRYPTRRFPNYKSINTFRTGLTMALNIPIPLEAYLCTGAGYLANLYPEYKTKALTHYNHVISSFRSILQLYDHGPPPEWICAVAAVLSWNEMIVFNSPQNRLAHLLGFFRLVEVRVLWRESWGPTRMLLEHYVHSCSINSLFHYDLVVGKKSIHYMDSMIAVLNEKPRPLGKEIIGVPETLTAVVYRLTVLNFEDVTQSPWTFELEAVTAMLSNWSRLEDSQSKEEFDSTPSGIALRLIGQLYYLACSCLMHHIKTRGTNATNEKVGECIEKASLLVQASDLRDWPSNSTVWPLIIFRIFSARPLESLIFTQPLENLVKMGKMQGYTAVLKFFARLSDEGIGPEVLQRKDILCDVHL